jgi:hypothetical protein
MQRDFMTLAHASQKRAGASGVSSWAIFIALELALNGS